MTEPPHGAPPTQPDPAEPEPVAEGEHTRPDPSAAGGQPDDEEERYPDRIPPQLAHYRIINQIPGGGQARLYHCADPDGRQVVIKIYHHARSAMDQVWPRWRAASGNHVVPLVEVPFRWAGRAYEVTPYLELGSLHDRTGHSRRPLPEAELEEVLRQVSVALRHIHTELGPDALVHRDIKPSNILVRSENPLQVRLTDFGIAVTQPDTYAARQTLSRSIQYLAPEGWQHESTPYQDWWSLGITLLELYRGRHPFQLPDGRWPFDDVLAREVLYRAVDLEDVVDQRWRILFRGLLIRDPERRWGYAEVQAWLAGEAPEVPYEADEDPGHERRGTPFSFAGAVVHQPDELAAAIATHWTDAAALVVGGRWPDLRDWAATVSSALAVAIDTVQRDYVEPGRPVDRVVAELMVTLDPAAAPVFQGWDIDEPGLVRLVARASANPPDLDAIGVIDSLYTSGSLQSLAGLRDCDGLAALDERWRRWCGLAERAGAEELPEGAELPGATVLRSLLLAVAVDPAAAERVAQRARRIATRRNLRIEWFRRLADRARGPDAPVYHAVMVLSEPVLQNPQQRFSPRIQALARRLIMQDLPHGVQLARERSHRSGRRLRRVGPVLAAGLGYLGLVAVAGAGVGVGTSAAQGVLTAVILLAAGACLYAGMSRPRHRFTDALLTGWAGAWVGLVIAVVIGGVVGLLVGPGAGWPTFWSTWITVIVAGAALGAVP